MSIKDRLLILGIIVAFSAGVFGYPYLIDWFHTDEPVHTAKVLTAVGVIFIIIGIVGFNNALVYKVKKDLEKIDEIADNLELRKIANEYRPPIKMPEMKLNASSLLTDDEKAMLYVVGKNPVYKVAATGERLITTEETIHIENDRIGLFVDTKV